jgi:hypothetical protein
MLRLYRFNKHRKIILHHISRIYYLIYYVIKKGNAKKDEFIFKNKLLTVMYLNLDRY